MTPLPTVRRMPHADVRRRTLAALGTASEPVTSAKLAAEVGCTQRRLTGDTAGVLFLLEAEGLVDRVGRKRGTRWFPAATA